MLGKRSFTDLKGEEMTYCTHIFRELRDSLRRLGTSSLRLLVISMELSIGLSLVAYIWGGSVVSFVARSMHPDAHRKMDVLVNDFWDNLELLALNTYFEAAGESRSGQWRATTVPLTRLLQPWRPDNLSGVIYQKGQGDSCGAYHFSWVCTQKSHEPRDRVKYWEIKYTIALPVLAGAIIGAVDIQDGPDHYYSPCVRKEKGAPKWATKMKKVQTIGCHEFFKSQEQESFERSRREKNIRVAAN